MNSKTTKRALISSAIALIVCISMLIGTTFAWFTDNVTSSNNRIQAGNLDVDLLMYNPNATTADKYESISGDDGDIFKAAASATNSNATLWEPGKTQVVYLAVRNLGLLALKYNILLNVTDNGLIGALEYSVINGLTPDTAAASGITDWATFKQATYSGDVKAGITIAAPNGAIKDQNDTDYFALAVHMKEDAGNTYMNKDIVIDLILKAAQIASESDSFGIDYDEFATFDDGTFIIRDKESTTNVKDDNSFTTTNKSGSFKTSGNPVDGKTPVATIDTAESKIEIESEGQTVITYDITVTDFEGDVNIELFIGKDLRAVKLYHEGALTNATYDSLTGYISFTTDSFSVFDISFVDATSDVLPLADVKPDTENIGKLIECSSYSPLDTVTLNTAYIFKATETPEEAKASPYANWHADFVVKLDKEVEGSEKLGIAGNYGSWGWLAFNTADFGTLPADTEFRLLHDYTGGQLSINYVGICEDVGTFKCGAFNTDGYAAGTTMTVELRLYETKDPADTETNTTNEETGNYIVLGVYNYTFR